jgi:hypothetical protein
MTHPDPEVLAEFRARLIPGRRGARISAHLSGCEHCAGLCGELAEITALLATIPPPAVPDQVAQRLDGVLAAETARRDESQRAAVQRTAAPVPSPPPRRRWDLRLVTLRVLAPAAAVAVLAAGGYGLSRLAGGPGTTVASGPTVTTVAQPRSSGPASALQLRPNAIPAGGASFQLTASRTDYLRTTLGPQLQQEVQRSAQNAAGPRQAAPQAVKGCVHRLTAGISPGTVVLAETAYFQGQRAIVVVAVSGNTDVAWVTTPSCSASSADLLDETTLAGTSAP